MTHFGFPPSVVTLRRKMFVFFGRMAKNIAEGTGSNYTLSENEKTAVRIFEKCLALEKSELLDSPSSDAIYIKTQEIVIVLKNQELRIINGKYSYDFNLPPDQCEKMRKRFDVESERRRKIMEEKIIAKTKRSLQDILSEVNEISSLEETL